MLARLTITKAIASTRGMRIVTKNTPDHTSKVLDERFRALGHSLFLIAGLTGRAMAFTKFCTAGRQSVSASVLGKPGASMTMLVCRRELAITPPRAD
jgi:hypothetical protein